MRFVISVAHTPADPSSSERTQTPIILTPATAPDFDVAALSSVTGAQLKFWVDQANAAAGRKALTKLGKVDDLRQQLAVHYHLDLTAAPSAVAPAAPSPSSTLAIQNCQWNALCDLGDKWEECTRTNMPFLLCVLSPGEHEPAST